jgi:hypothetical protein
MALKLDLAMRCMDKSRSRTSQRLRLAFGIDESFMRHQGQLDRFFESERRGNGLR